MSLVRDMTLVAGKDLRIEARSRVTVNQVLPFAGVMVLLFAFALDPDRGVLRRAAPGLFWVAVLLSALLAVSRSVSVEADNGVRDALRLAGLDGAAVFLGKALAVAVELLLLEAVLGTALLALYGVHAHTPWLLVISCVAATAGLATAGTVYGVLAAGLRVRETLLPLLMLPVVAPVLLGGTKAWEAALAGAPGDAWPWMQVLGVFAVIYTTMGILAFGPLLEET